ncbi:MAG TPA: hypothetical protein VFG69_03735 [Nannocystaceae bacterium]|jgi:hypothetical protein|nr:hypothetical protein [Nannocystaceae bacterium]
MNCASPIPTERDLAVSPELAILAALRVSIEIATETLRAVHPIDELVRHQRCDGDLLNAALIIHAAEALRLAIVDYEQRMAGLHEPA